MRFSSNNGSSTLFYEQLWNILLKRKILFASILFCFTLGAISVSILFPRYISEALLIPEDYLETGKVTVYGMGGGFSTFAAAEGGNLSDFLVDHLVAGKLDEATRARVVARLSGPFGTRAPLLADVP